MRRGGVAEWLVGLIEKRGGWVLMGALGASLLVIPVVRGLAFKESLLDLLPERSPVVRDFSLFTRVFSFGDALVALIECKDPHRLLAFTETFAARLQGNPLLKAVQYKMDFHKPGGNPYRYFFNILSAREFDKVAAKLSREGIKRSVTALKALLLAPAPPVDRRILTMDPLGLLTTLAEHLSRRGLPVDPESGYYLGSHGTALLMILRPAGSSYEISFNKKLLNGLAKIEDEVRSAMGEGAAVAVSYTGSYVYAFYFARWLQQDFTVLSLLSLGGLILLFFLFFRRPLVLPLTLIPLGASILWTLALAGVLLGHLNMVSIAFSAIVLGLGIDIAIHFYARFEEEMMGRGGFREALRETYANTGRAILTAVATTVFVFFVFAFSSFKGIAELGVLCGLGMLVNIAAMLLVFPSLLVGAHRRGILNPTKHQERWRGRLEVSLQRFYLLHGRKVLVAVVLILLLAGWLAKDVRFEQSIRQLEPRDLPPALVNKRIQDLFGERGEKLIVLIRDRELERALQKNDSLRETLEEMRAQGTIQAFDSLAFFLPSVKTQRRNLMRLHNLDRGRVLEDLRETLLSQGFRLKPFAKFFVNFRETGEGVLRIDTGLPEGHPALVGNYLRRDDEDFLIATYIYCTDIRNFMEAYHRLSSGVGPWRQGVLITGFPLVENAFGRIVKQDFGTLSFISILGILLILLLSFRGWRETLVILIPLFGAAIFFLALMTILDISINLFNLIVIPLIFGVGVDDHVHIIHRYLENRGRNGIGKAVIRSGRAVVLTSLTTMVGFGALMASRFDGLVLLGSTTLIGIVLAMLFALVVMPALIGCIHRPTGKGPLDTPNS
jgi:predicted RND superfamily exporter protein